MAEQWYYSQEGTQYGPVAPAQLRELAASGKLGADDLIWKEGLENWIPASRLKGLFPAGTQAPPASDSQFAVDTGTESRARRTTSRSSPGATWNILANSLTTFAQRIPTFVFVTIIWYLASLIASGLLVTAALGPALTIGYVTIVCLIGNNQPYSLGDFVIFFRHGWNSLYYLLVLTASTLVILAVAIAIVFAWIFLNGFISTNLMHGIHPAVAITVYVLTTIIFATIVQAFIILLFCLFVHTAKSSPNDERPLEFICDTFTDTMMILTKERQMLGWAGLWITLCQTGFIALFGGCVYGIGRLARDYLGIGMLLTITIVTVVMGIALSITLIAFTLVFYTRAAEYLTSKTANA